MRTEFRLHPSFFLFWALFCLLDGGECLRYFVPAALLHEAGHVLAVWMCGGHVRCVELSGPGICMEVHHPRGYGGDFLIAAAGPAAGLTAALIGGAMRYCLFSGASLLLTVFNCLPILPLDGGCMLVSLLCMTPLGLRGEDIVRFVSRVGAGLVALFGLIVLWQTRTNAALLVIGLVLLVGKDRATCKV